MSKGLPVLQCVVFQKIPTNESMKPFKLNEHIGRFIQILPTRNWTTSKSKKTSSRGLNWIVEQEFSSKYVFSHVSLFQSVNMDTSEDSFMICRIAKLWRPHTRSLFQLQNRRRCTPLERLSLNPACLKLHNLS